MSFTKKDQEFLMKTNQKADSPTVELEDELIANSIEDEKKATPKAPKAEEPAQEESVNSSALAYAGAKEELLANTQGLNEEVKQTAALLVQGLGETFQKELVVGLMHEQALTLGQLNGEGGWLGQQRLALAETVKKSSPKKQPKNLPLGSSSDLLTSF